MPIITHRGPNGTECVYVVAGDFTKYCTTSSNIACMSGDAQHSFAAFNVAPDNILSGRLSIYIIVPFYFGRVDDS